MRSSNVALLNFILTLFLNKAKVQFKINSVPNTPILVCFLGSNGDVFFLDILELEMFFIVAVTIKNLFNLQVYLLDIGYSTITIYILKMFLYTQRYLFLPLSLFFYPKIVLFLYSISILLPSSIILTCFR